MDLFKLQDVCVHYKDSASEYYIDPIPEKKVNNARASLNIPLDEQIFALIDFTAFGSAKDALVVAANGLYWKKTGDQAPTCLAWDKLQQCTLSEKPGILWKSISFGDDLELDLGGAGTLQKNDNPVVIGLLCDLKALAEGKVTEEVISENLEQSSDGLVECEFCAGKLKPEVTYCKHCGIKLRG